MPSRSVALLPPLLPRNASRRAAARGANFRESEFLKPSGTLKHVCCTGAHARVPCRQEIFGLAVCLAVAMIGGCVLRNEILHVHFHCTFTRIQFEKHLWIVIARSTMQFHMCLYCSHMHVFIRKILCHVLWRQVRIKKLSFDKIAIFELPPRHVGPPNFNVDAFPWGESTRRKKDDHLCTAGGRNTSPALIIRGRGVVGMWPVLSHEHVFSKRATNDPGPGGMSSGVLATSHGRHISKIVA